MKLRTLFAAITLICAAFDNGALTLGRVRGAAVFGQPLDVVVEMEADAGEEAAAKCFEVEVFYADMRQNAGQVQLAVESAAPSRSAHLRIRSLTSVDEPVVSLNVRSGCGQKLSRRYVLLADLPHQAAVQPSLPVVAPVARASAAVGAAPARMVVEGAFVTPVGAGAATAVVKPAAPRVQARRTEGKTSAAPVAAPAPAKDQGKGKDQSKSKDRAEGKAKVAARKEASPGTPRLKLDPMELLSDRIANIGSFMTFEPSEDALLNIQKMKTLEAELKALREAAARNERNLADVKTRLQQAEAERFPAVALYGLMALVCLSLMAAAWFWSRQRRSAWGGSNAWSAGLDEPVAGGHAEAVTAAAPRSAAVHPTGEPAGTAAHADTGIAPSFDEPSIQLGSIFSSLMQTDAPTVEASQPPMVARTAESAKLVRCLSSESIIDVRRKAQQYTDARQFDQAIETLASQIGESDEPNPFVYLDLLKLFHALDVKREFQKLSQDFNLLFNGRVPEFALFADEGKPLEAYPETMARICALWPSAKVLEFIETCIFRDPWVAASEPYDLAAFRELLFLHALARYLVMAAQPSPAGTPVDELSASEFDSSSSAGMPSQIDFQDSVASTFPEMSRSELAELFGPEEAAPTEMLDLDLSALELESLPAPLSATPGAQRARP